MTNTNVPPETWVTLLDNLVVPVNVDFGHTGVEIRASTVRVSAVQPEARGKAEPKNIHQSEMGTRLWYKLGHIVPYIYVRITFWFPVK